MAESFRKKNRKAINTEIDKFVCMAESFRKKNRKAINTEIDKFVCGGDEGTLLKEDTRPHSPNGAASLIPVIT
jgi:hypothetical protein